MTPEKRSKIVRILSLTVIVAGMLVVIGWVFDIGILKSIWPTWTSMKFDTAIAFLLSGITLYYIVRALEGEYDKAQVALSVTSLIIILIMGILFFSALFKVHTGVEELFVKETTIAPKTVSPGRPSVPTMINFMLIGFAAILVMWNAKKLQFKLRIIGLIVAAIGALAVIGYCINAPLLYYFIEGTNSAMACSTAVLFVILGIGLLCL